MKKSQKQSIAARSISMSFLLSSLLMLLISASCNRPSPCCTEMNSLAKEIDRLRVSFPEQKQAYADSVLQSYIQQEEQRLQDELFGPMYDIPLAELHYQLRLREPKDLHYAVSLFTSFEDQRENLYAIGSTMIGYDSWKIFKNVFKKNPESVEKWFNRSTPALRAIYRRLGTVYSPTMESREYFTKPFNQQLVVHFAQSYALDPLKWRTYYDDLKKKYDNHLFDTFKGYENVEGDSHYYFTQTPLCKEFMRWVWHQEYGKECAAAAVRMIDEIRSW